MTKLVLLIIALVGVAFLVERKRGAKHRATPTVTAAREGYLTADEAGPSETGRFRVEKLLSKNPEMRPDAKDTKADPLAEDDEPLPDPFDDPNRQR